MAYKTTKNKGKTKKANLPRINPLSCPPDISLEEWQRRLRRQAAEKENFGIFPPDVPGGHFVVSSAKSGRRYNVDYFGPSSPMNRCNCLDFRTNHLGTCKHIEAISLYEDGKYARRRYGRPENTIVYVDYLDGRKVKIRRGSHVSVEFEELIKRYFDKNNTLLDMGCDPSEFIRKAGEYDEGFQWENDALERIIEMRDIVRRRQIVKEKYADSRFDGLLKMQLHPYQADGVRFAFSEGRTINADEMGLGKTVQAIATAELLRREGLVESVIIICPTSLKYQWLAEIKKFTDSTAVVIEGNPLKRRDMLRDPSYFYRIISFHSMANNIKCGFIPETDMVIYDELQRLKNRDTHMGKQLRLLSSPYVMALSGTPLENKLEELYSVTQLVDQFLLGPLYIFNNETTLKDDTGKIVGYKNLHSISERLKHTLIRRKKADVKLQMPSRTDTFLYVPMTKEQAEIHEEYRTLVGRLIFKWRRQKFLSETDRKRLMLYLSTMRMVCDSTFILDQKSRHDTKIDEAMAIINNMLADEDGKVVIFSQWERMLRILSQELEAEGIDFCFLHGGVPSPKRKNLIDRFRDDPDCRIFLSTDAGSTGLNLQTASLLINLDLPWNPAVLEQRIARIYRLGQVNPVQIINMVARGTIEEGMISTLKFKSDLAAGILDGGNDAIFLENKKFDKILEVVEEMVENESAETETPKGEAPAVESKPEKADTTSTPSLFDTPTEAKPVEPKPVEPKSVEPQPDKMRSLVADSMTAIGNLAAALRNPGAAQALADALVKEDPATGQSTLNIPVPDKNTVVNILSAFATILSKQ
ncbi:MAG: SNF2-related protein [Lachnoclostridium sp.]|nr:SNF2-related protein [Lachnoclostridium sp.]